MKNWQRSKGFVISWYVLFLIWLLLYLIFYQGVFGFIFVILTAFGSIYNHINYKRAVRSQNTHNVKSIDLNK